MNKSINLIKEELQDKLDKAGQYWFDRQPAVLGNYAGVVKVPNTQNMVYVRLNNGQVIQVFNNVAPNIANWKVFIGREKSQPTLLKVIEVRWVYNISETVAYVLFHHGQHEYPSPDTVWVRRDQIMPLLVLPGTGLTAVLYGDIIYSNGMANPIRVADQTLDLSGYAVTTGANYVLLEVLTDGTLNYVVGATYGSIDTLIDAAPIPAPTTGAFPICAFIMHEGQTEFRRDNERRTIIDLRMFTSDVPNLDTAVWGSITGDITDQTDLLDLLEETVPNRYLGVYNYRNGSVYQLALVLSKDARNWESSTRPVIPLGAGGDFDDAGMAHGCLLQVNGVLYLYYGGFDGAVWKIGLQMSYDHGVTWDDKGVVLSPSQAWENSTTNEVNYPKVFYDIEEVDPNKRFKMWYNGGQYGAGGIGYAYSSTGLPGSWTKFASNPVLQLTTGWESFYMVPGAIAKRGSEYILFYSASADSSGDYASGYATFNDPEGTYTKYAGNPILEGDGITSTLSATVNITDVQVTVADATLFPIGAPVWVYNASARYLTTVKARISATVLELTDPAPVQVTSTGGGVRSAAYNSVTIESVLYDGGWLLSFTGFQPGIDANIVHETSMLAWADPELSTARIDYGAGLAVPFPLAESTAAESSNENLFFISTYDSDERVQPQASISPDYDDISANDPSTDVTGAELEELTDGSETTLHSHAAGSGVGEILMEDGVTFPPVPITTEDGTDWIYSD